ncbi:hypothetical protein KRP22_004154 [Phytophthora ramorum]|nr:Protein BREAST CANCER SUSCEPTIBILITY 1-like protein [Phytophthora ramorum]
MLKIDPTKTSKFEHTTQFRLAEMPPWTLKRLERAVETFSAQLQCAICLCAYDNPVSLPCNHCFCEECIHRALELKTLCPICKAPAKKRRLRYDTTVQELLCATEMLCAAPEDAAAEKQPQSIEMKTTKQTTEKQVTTAPSDVKIAAAKPVKVAATTPERRSPPRRRAQTKNSPGSQTQTLMDAWITGGSTSLRPQLVKMKTEKQTTPVRRASPRRRDLYSEMASPMSPALFEISAPRAAKTQVAEAIAGSSAERLHCEDTMTQIDNVDEQRWSAANPPSVFDGQTQLPLEIETFQVGALVDVIERQWSGINKRGGAARIITVHGDGFYGVKFLIGTGMDRRVPGAFIRRPAEDIASDSTPSHSARKRQRRRPSDIMASPNTGAPKTRPSPHSENKVKPKTKALTTHSGMVFLCSGFKENRMQQIDEWAELLGAEVVQYWSNHVTHLIVKCVSAEEVKDEERSMDESDSKSPPQARKDGKRKLFSDPKPGRWVKIRSLKYLKALVAGRWIVSDEWLQVCADHGGYVSEVNYEADGHWKGRRIHDAVKRSRATRDKLLQLTSLNVDRSNVGTMLFADFCFHLIGEFLPPMPPVTELNSLICMGGGKLIPFMDDIPDEMHKRENRTRKLIIVSDKLNPNALRQQTRHLKAKSQVKAVSAAIIVNYLWVINSISEAKLRELP